MFRHRVNFGIKFFFDFDNVFLIFFSDEVDGETNLAKSSTTANPV
jgi:hypothetical protein